MGKSITVLTFLAIICLALSLPAAADDLTIVSSKRAYMEAQEWLDFLKSKEIPVIHVTPNDYSKGSDAKYIVLMGGLDEPGGIREIVKKVISKEEFKSVSRDSNGRIFIKYVVPERGKGAQIWEATVNYLIFAGPDMASAEKVRKNRKDIWWEELSIWFDIDESSPVPFY